MNSEGQAEDEGRVERELPRERPSSIMLVAHAFWGLLVSTSETRIEGCRKESGQLMLSRNYKMCTGSPQTCSTIGS